MFAQYFSYALSLIPDVVDLVNFELGDLGFGFLEFLIGVTIFCILIRALLFRVPFAGISQASYRSHLSSPDKGGIVGVDTSLSDWRRKG